MPPRIHSHNLLLVAPLGERSDGHGGFGVGVIGLVVVGELARGEGEGVVDGVGASVGADCVSAADGGGGAGDCYWASGQGVGSAPVEGEGGDADLVGVLFFGFLLVKGGG